MTKHIQHSISKKLKFRSEGGERSLVRVAVKACFSAFLACFLHDPLHFQKIRNPWGSALEHFRDYHRDQKTLKISIRGGTFSKKKIF